MKPILTAALALAVAAPALAVEPDPERGRALAERWCVSCHVIEPDSPGGDAGPSFPHVVNGLGRNDDELRVWLAEPHYPMPSLDLSAIDIEDIVAHIATLRE